MLHLPFSTQGLFFISSGFRKGSSGMPSSIHFTNLQRGEQSGGHRPCCAPASPSVRGRGCAAAEREELGENTALGVTPVLGGSGAGGHPALGGVEGELNQHPSTQPDFRAQDKAKKSLLSPAMCSCPRAAGPCRVF